MNKNFSELPQLLSKPTSPHLSEELLAEIVTAEISGEVVELLFKGEMAHVGGCEKCAQAYSYLYVTMEQTLGQMSASAGRVSPSEVYTHLLLQKLGVAMLTPQEKQAVEQWVEQLPLFLTEPPAEVGPTWQLNLPTQLFAKIKQSLGSQLVGLALYLRGVAEQNWGRALKVVVTGGEGKQGIQFAPGQTLAVSTLSGDKPLKKWALLERQVGSFLVKIEAEQVSELACEVRVRVDRPGLRDAAGRPVHLFYGSQQVTAVTNAKGVATFDQIPIASLPLLRCEITS